MTELEWQDNKLRVLPSTWSRKEGQWPTKLGRRASKEKFQHHPGLSRKVIGLDDAEQAIKIKEGLKRYKLLQDRVEFILNLVKRVKGGEVTREALALGVEGYVQELRKALEIIQTQEARERRTRR